MGYRARTSIEIKVANIKKLMKRVKSGQMTLRDAEINRRLEKLKLESEAWYEDLRPKYIQMVRTMENA